MKQQPLPDLSGSASFSRRIGGYKVRNYDSPDPKLVIASIRQVLATGDIEHLNKGAYRFLITHASFIAHYDHAGFKSAYRDCLDSFVEMFLQEHRSGWDIYLNNPRSYLYDVSYRGVLLADIIRALIPVFRQWEEPVKARVRRHENERKLAQLQQLAAELGYEISRKG